ncbi:MAG: hypothetical protein JWN95_419, partial [Frankiales bacterium]|nr:hypothetical protein [Frankiales bacterium]
SDEVLGELPDTVRRILAKNQPAGNVITWYTAYSVVLAVGTAAAVQLLLSKPGIRLDRRLDVRVSFGGKETAVSVTTIVTAALAEVERIRAAIPVSGVPGPGSGGGLGSSLYGLGSIGGPGWPSSGYPLSSGDLDSRLGLSSARPGASPGPRRGSSPGPAWTGDDYDPLGRFRSASGVGNAGMGAPLGLSDWRLSQAGSSETPGPLQTMLASSGGWPSNVVPGVPSRSASVPSPSPYRSANSPGPSGSVMGSWDQAGSGGSALAYRSVSGLTTAEAEAALRSVLSFQPYQDTRTANPRHSALWGWCENVRRAVGLGPARRDAADETLVSDAVDRVQRAFGDVDGLATLDTNHPWNHPWKELFDAQGSRINASVVWPSDRGASRELRAFVAVVLAICRCADVLWSMAAVPIGASGRRRPVWNVAAMKTKDGREWPAVGTRMAWWRLWDAVAEARVLSLPVVVAVEDGRGSRSYVAELVALVAKVMAQMTQPSSGSGSKTEMDSDEVLVVLPATVHRILTNNPPAGNVIMWHDASSAVRAVGTAAAVQLLLHDPGINLQCRTAVRVWFGGKEIAVYVTTIVPAARAEVERIRAAMPVSGVPGPVARSSGGSGFSYRSGGSIGGLGPRPLWARWSGEGANDNEGHGPGPGPDSWTWLDGEGPRLVGLVGPSRKHRLRKPTFVNNARQPGGPGQSPKSWLDPLSIDQLGSFTGATPVSTALIMRDEPSGAVSVRLPDDEITARDVADQVRAAHPTDDRRPVQLLWSAGNYGEEFATKFATLLGRVAYFPASGLTAITDPIGRHRLVSGSRHSHSARTAVRWRSVSPSADTEGTAAQRMAAQSAVVQGTAAQTTASRGAIAQGIPLVTNPSMGTLVGAASPHIRLAATGWWNYRGDQATDAPRPALAILGRFVLRVGLAEDGRLIVADATDGPDAPDWQLADLAEVIADDPRYRSAILLSPPVRLDQRAAFERDVRALARALAAKIENFEGLYLAPSGFELGIIGLDPSPELHDGWRLAMRPLHGSAGEGLPWLRYDGGDGQPGWVTDGALYRQSRPSALTVAAVAGQLRIRIRLDGSLTRISDKALRNSGLVVDFAWELAALIALGPPPRQPVKLLSIEFHLDEASPAAERIEPATSGTLFNDRLAVLAPRILVSALAGGWLDHDRGSLTVLLLPDTGTKPGVSRRAAFGAFGDTTKALAGNHHRMSSFADDERFYVGYARHGQAIVFSDDPFAATRPELTFRPLGRELEVFTLWVDGLASWRADPSSAPRDPAGLSEVYGEEWKQASLLAKAVNDAGWQPGIPVVILFNWPHQFAGKGSRGQSLTAFIRQLASRLVTAIAYTPAGVEPRQDVRGRHFIEPGADFAVEYPPDNSFEARLLTDPAGFLVDAETAAFSLSMSRVRDGIIFAGSTLTKQILARVSERDADFSSAADLSGSQEFTVSLEANGAGQLVAPVARGEARLASAELVGHLVRGWAYGDRHPAAWTPKAMLGRGWVAQQSLVVDVYPARASDELASSDKVTGDGPRIEDLTAWAAFASALAREISREDRLASPSGLGEPFDTGFVVSLRVRDRTTGAVIVDWAIPSLSPYRAEGASGVDARTVALTRWPRQVFAGDVGSAAVLSVQAGVNPNGDKFVAPHIFRIAVDICALSVFIDDVGCPVGLTAYGDDVALTRELLGHWHSQGVFGDVAALQILVLDRLFNHIALTPAQHRSFLKFATAVAAELKLEVYVAPPDVRPVPFLNENGRPWLGLERAAGDEPPRWLVVGSPGGLELAETAADPARRRYVTDWLATPAGNLINPVGELVERPIGVGDLTHAGIDWAATARIFVADSRNAGVDLGSVKRSWRPVLSDPSGFFIVCQTRLIGVMRPVDELPRAEREDSSDAALRRLIVDAADANHGEVDVPENKCGARHGNRGVGGGLHGGAVDAATVARSRGPLDLGHAQRLGFPATAVYSSSGVLRPAFVESGQRPVHGRAASASAIG